MDIKLDNNCYDEEIITNALQSEEEMTSLYNHFANKCATANVRSEFLNLLNDSISFKSKLPTKCAKEVGIRPANLRLS